jgi:hypothetical protein
MVWELRKRLNPMKRLAEFRDRGRLGRAWLRGAMAALCAGSCVSLVQASEPIDNSPHDTPSLVARPKDVAAGKLVQSPQGTVIGTVHNLLSEPASGQPAYVLVATDSGITPIPYWAITHLLRDAHIVVDRTMLAAAPRIPGGEEQKGKNAHWMEQADSYWRAYR